MPLSSDGLFIFGISGHVGTRLAEMAASSFARVTGSALRGPFASNCNPDGSLSEKGRRELAECAYVISTVAPLNGVDPIVAHCGRALSLQAQRGDLVWFGYLSTTAVYGDRQGGLVTEDDALTPTLERGKHRVAAEQAWRETGCPLHVFRLPGIYGPGTGPLAKARTADKLLVKENHVFCRIYVDDICSAVLLSMRRPNPGRAYNVCDDEPAPSHVVSLFACELLGISAPPLVRFEDAQVSPMLQSFYAESRRISNTRLRSELGFVPAYPSYREGLRKQIEREASLPPLLTPPASTGTRTPTPVGEVPKVAPHLAVAPPSFFSQWAQSIFQWIMGVLTRLYVRVKLWQVHKIVLVDNGSLRPGSTLGMRRIAALLSRRLHGVPVEALSYRFSDRIDASQLGGVPAKLISAEALKGSVLVAPLFLGASDAVTKDIGAMVSRQGKLLPPMVRLDSTFDLCTVTACLARSVLNLRLSQPFRVVVVDHGSPNRLVNKVRRALAARLRLNLGSRATVVVDCSMERRPGPEYDFNDPILERVFDQGGLDEGDVALAPVFLFSGNHAGPGGDVDKILQGCMQKYPKLKVRVGSLLCDEVNDDLVVSMLANRVGESI